MYPVNLIGSRFLQAGAEDLIAVGFRECVDVGIGDIENDAVERCIGEPQADVGHDIAQCEIARDG